MSEKFPIPQADRLVGKGDVDPKDIEGRFGSPILNEKGEPIVSPKELLTRVFTERSNQPYSAYEISKSERDLELIRHAEFAVKEYAKQYGREEFIDITPDHIHFFEEGGVGKFTEGRIAVGSHATVLGEVLVERRSDLQTAITTFHELWHTLGSYHSVQVTSEQKLDWYRSGFGMKSRTGEEEWFHHLDEALTGYMTRRYVYEKLQDLPEFSMEIERSRSGEVEIDTTRENELADLTKLVEDLHERNTTTFNSVEDVFNLFIHAQVSGNVLPVARLMEKTYGKGSFRKLGAF